ncbi:MAG: nitrile hydratase subunit beta [Rhodospirillaceae bacterium]|nr:nitrile hydratase subunit beta [Rhodospirillaceae bacterium]
MGGEPAGPVNPAGHEIEPWEKRIEAILRCMQLRATPVVTVDELRRGIEQMPAEQYDTLSYYERWIASLTDILVEKGILDRAEVEARMAAIKQARAKAAA